MGLTSRVGLRRLREQPLEGRHARVEWLKFGHVPSPNRGHRAASCATDVVTVVAVVFVVFISPLVCQRVVKTARSSCGWEWLFFFLRGVWVQKKVSLVRARLLIVHTWGNPLDFYFFCGPGHSARQTSTPLTKFQSLTDPHEVSAPLAPPVS